MIFESIQIIVSTSNDSICVGSDSVCPDARLHVRKTDDTIVVEDEDLNLIYSHFRRLWFIPRNTSLKWKEYNDFPT